MDFVNQNWEALRADIFRFTLEGQVQKRYLIVGAFAVQANRFGHEILQVEDDGRSVP